MDAQVGHGAHGGLTLVEEPGVLARIHAPGLGAAVAEGGAEGENVPQHPVRHQLAGLLVGLCQALVLADHEELAALPGGGHHGLAVGQGGGHGLFTEHMLARPQGGDGQLRVGGVGRANAHRVDGRVGQQRLPGGVGPAAPLGGQGLGPLLVQVIVPGQPGRGVGGVLGDVAHLGNLAAADDADVEHG